MGTSTDIHFADRSAAHIATGGGYAHSRVSDCFYVEGKRHKLTQSQKRIIQAIADAQGEPISKAKIAEIAGCCEKAVERSLALFRRAGLVEVAENRYENGGQLSNSYWETAKMRALMGASTETCATPQTKIINPAFAPANPIRSDP